MPGALQLGVFSGVTHRLSELEMAQIGALRAIFDSVPSLHESCLKPGPGGGIGRRYGLKIRCPKGRASSSLAPGTNKNKDIQVFPRITMSY